MSEYVWGLATLPIAAGVVFAVWIVAKLGYLGLGAIGKVGVVRYGKADDDYRFKVGALSASADRCLVFNRGRTGVVLFTGLAHKQLGFGGVEIYASALRKADYTIRTEYLTTPTQTDERGSDE